MCYFLDNCRGLKHDCSPESSINEHHFFFPRSLFDNRIWRGKRGRNIAFPCFATYHREFHQFFDKNCKKSTERKCKKCCYNRVCCYSTTQPRELQDFVRDVCLGRQPEPKQKPYRPKLRPACRQQTHTPPLQKSQGLALLSCKITFFFCIFSIGIKLL